MIRFLLNIKIIKYEKKENVTAIREIVLKTLRPASF